MNKDKVALRIKQRRHELRITQTELAQISGLTPAAISQFEAGTRHPSFKTLSALSNALKVTSDFLIGQTEKRYEDLLADPRVSAMLKGMMDLNESDKEILFKFYEFLKSRQ